MSNDLVPDGTPGWLANVNLPQLLLGPAGKALSRLLGALAEILGAKLEAYVQGIRDNKEAKTIVSKKIAEAAGITAAADATIIENAMTNLVPKQYREATNKLGVLQKTIEQLNEEPPPADAQEVDDDWLNVFERYTENASSEKLRDLWARVLAGEIRHPGSFALRTLSFISQLDQRIASIFERTVESVVSGSVLPLDVALEGAPLDDLLELEDFGLVIGVGGSLRHTVPLSSSGAILRYDHEMAILIQGTEGASLQLASVKLTRARQEIYKLLKPSFNIDRAKQTAELIGKEENVTAVKLVNREEANEVRCRPN